MTDHNGTAETRWQTDWSNLQARRQEGQGEQHDRIEYLRERKELERQQDLTTPQAAQRLARGGGD